MGIGQYREPLLAEAVEGGPHLHLTRPVLQVGEHGLALAAARHQPAGHGHLALCPGTGLQGVPHRAGVLNRDAAREAGRVGVDARRPQVGGLLATVGDQAVDAAVGLPGRGLVGGGQSPASIFTTWYSTWPRGVVTVTLSFFLQPMMALPSGLSFDRRS